MSLTFEVTGRPELVTALRRAGERASEFAGEALRSEAELVMRDSKREVPIDEGTLRNSGFVKPPKRVGPVVEVEMGYGGAASSYAVYLHEGTGPNVGRPVFMPPVEPFKEWAKRVLGDEKLGFAIAINVGARGLGPRKFLERPLKARASGMGARLARRIGRTLDRER